MAFSKMKVAGIARLTADPEVTSFPNGTSICKFRIAFTGKTTKQGDQWVEKPVFMQCEAFSGDKGRKLGEVINNYCAKGSRVYIDGHIEMDQWEDKNGGGTKQAFKIAVEDCIILDKKEDRPQKQQKQQTQNVPDDSGDDDSIPF